MSTQPDQHVPWRSCVSTRSRLASPGFARRGGRGRPGSLFSRREEIKAKWKSELLPGTDRWSKFLPFVFVPFLVLRLEEELEERPSGGG